MHGFLLALALFASTMQCVTSCAMTVGEDQQAPPCHQQSGTHAACAHEVVLDVAAAPHFDLHTTEISLPEPSAAIPAKTDSEAHEGRGPAPPLLTLRV